MTPNETRISNGTQYLGLSDKDFKYFAPYFWKFPVIYYGEWNHAYRTSCTKKFLSGSMKVKRQLIMHLYLPIKQLNQQAYGTY